MTLTILNILVRTLLLALVGGLLASCTTYYGAGNVAPSGYSYNNAIAKSKDEQLLLNLVRLRYRDTVVFMDIASVTAQHQYSAGASTETLFPFNSISGGASLVVPNVAYSETPTISYAPLKGSEFAENLLSPISTETLVLLANSGWSIERLLTCCVEQLGPVSNAPSASGPTPVLLPDNSDFRRAAELLRKLQSEGRLFVEHGTDADQSHRMQVVVDAAPGSVCETLHSMLALPKDDCMMRLSLVPTRRNLQDGELLAQTRTVLGALYALSHAVSVPDEHANAGLVTSSRSESQNTPSWDAFLGGQFNVRSTQQEPKAAFVKIQYRGHWFWIADSDLETKTTFSLLSFLLSLQSAQGAGSAPLLTLSAGQ